MLLSHSTVREPKFVNYISPPIPNNTDKFKSLKANMASSPFPSPVELSVASALLLLHTRPPCVSLTPHPPEFDCHGSALRESSINSCGSEESSDSLNLSSVSENSKSCASTLTSDGSSREIQAQKLRAISVVARCHGINLQVARKSRSKVFWSSDDQKLAIAKPSTTMSSESVSTEASCLSTSSSARSLRCVARGEKRHAPMMKVQEDMKKRHAGSVSSTGLLRSRAEDILKLLSRGGSSEVKIRQALGDSPDTSKALRMLLKREEVKRSGTGGRSDPFLYTIA